MKKPNLDGIFSGKASRTNSAMDFVHLEFSLYIVISSGLK